MHLTWPPQHTTPHTHTHTYKHRHRLHIHTPCTHTASCTRDTIPNPSLSSAHNHLPLVSPICPLDRRHRWLQSGVPPLSPGPPPPWRQLPAPRSRPFSPSMSSASAPATPSLLLEPKAMAPRH